MAVPSHAKTLYEYEEFKKAESVVAYIYDLKWSTQEKKPFLSQNG
ncbi:hypothetical protein P343_15365 [Sporolactobacillus laevolacticus DSM 442]|uniref:Uncharacterized protein n=1 Tax=Sporolactobacillus laevolacticus DSM 442 TaxID=1395513 RepID=V6IUJ2_9BACL|nr:hypothetical protein P343_15365 [Sporolactobacillus laevolacticus DSM 442]